MNTSSLQTSESWLKTATATLDKAGISTARLDCLVLLEDATSKDRGWLLAHPEYALQVLALKKLNGWVERRIRHEPIAYIRGKSEFYGRDFIVTPDTLQPRPETETMIDLLKQIAEDGKDSIVDVGTGSGCLAITAKLEFPKSVVIATDIDSVCLKIAIQNAKKLGANIKFYQGDLLESLSTSHYPPTTIILSNLPYVPASHAINQAAIFEPRLAIFGGSDGLDLYRRMFGQIAKMPTKPKYIFTESLRFQHKGLAKIAEAHGYSLLRNSDYVQCFSSL